jgi:hypothetical protein
VGIYTNTGAEISIIATAIYNIAAIMEIIVTLLLNETTRSNNIEAGILN